MIERIRVGIVGAGENTRVRHIPGLQAIDGVEIIGVCNRTLESSKRVVEEFGIPRTYERWDELVADAELDAVVIGTWPNMHCLLTLAALESGKHVLCEARMSRNASEAHEMLRAARARPHLVAQIVPSPMTLGVDATVRRLLAERYLGDLLAINVRDSGPFLDRDAALHWRQDTDLSGYNVMTLGIWYEAVMRWVGEATRVTAMTEVFIKTRNAADGLLRSVRVPEHLDVTAKMACGAQAHFQVSAVAGLTGAPEVFVSGSEGTLHFSEDQLHGGRRGDSRLTEIDIPANEKGGWRVEQEFVNAIRGLEPVQLTTFTDGVKYMEFTEAVARSASTGKAVDLPLR